MVCRNLSAFADAPRAGSAEAKIGWNSDGVEMYDAPRAGSAEAKVYVVVGRCAVKDAPRAGSAEAKLPYLMDYINDG